MKIQCDCGEWFEDSFIAEWGGVCSTCKAEADLKSDKKPVATVPCSDGVKTCATCKAFGAQGVYGLRKETEGDRRYCSFAVFSDYDNPNMARTPEWEVTYGNAGGSKGNIYVYEDYGCINHNAKFDEF